MTLIIGVGNPDHFVMAADSLTTRGNTTISCDTQKLHQISSLHIAAAAGNSQVLGRPWRDIVPDFLRQWVGPSIGHVVPAFRNFVDAEAARIPRNHVGANAGGNNFLIAGPDALNGTIEAWTVERKGINRAFGPPVIAAPAVPPVPVYWLGDTTTLQAHIAATSHAYASGMTEPQAVAFAVDAIRVGTVIARNAGVTTIGGDFIYVAVATTAGVTFMRYLSNIRCP